MQRSNGRCSVLVVPTERILKLSDEGKTPEDPNEELGENQKRIDVEGSATVSDSEGPTHDVDVAATARVTDLREKQEEKEQESLGVNCVFCGRAATHWHADCPIAQAEASKGATETKAKTAVAASSRQHFGATGRVD